MYCQVVYICGCIPARIQHALVDLPETLDETYQRTLREINKADWEFAHRLFQFVAVASRPLRVEELAEMLAYDFKAGQIPKFHEGWRIEDPVDAVLSTCSSLLAIVDGGYPFGKVIQFSHFSVKEFLISTRLAEATDNIPRRYHISMTPAHTLVAQACLGILLHLDKDVVTRDSLKKWPLAEYAAEHWAGHALFEGVSQNVEDGVKQLFDPRKPHLAVSVWIRNPWTRNRRAERPLPPLGTHLHYAAIWGVHFIIEFLIIEHPQEVRSQDFPGDATPLHLASQNGRVEVARMLVERGADVATQNKDGETPLHPASRNGGVEVARMLVEHGADVAAQNKDGETPLHLASQYGNVEVVRILVERGADLAAQKKYGETPLHMASQTGQVDVARMLVERGADLAAQNKYGETPLHMASQNGQVEVARMLVERGADVAAQNKDGKTPLHLALQYREVEVARMLVERGADVAAQNKDGETPLHLASQYGEGEVARMLVERGADVAAQGEDGDTPLHFASLFGHVEVARLLIERGADVSVQNKHGETPLHRASRPDSTDLRLYDFILKDLAEVSRILLEQGADVNAKNKDGLTPFFLASQDRYRRDPRRKVLLDHGAIDSGDGCGELEGTYTFYSASEIESISD